MRSKITAIVAGAALLGSSVAMAQYEDPYARDAATAASDEARVDENTQPAEPPRPVETLRSPRTVTATATATASGPEASATVSTVKKKKRKTSRSWEESARFFVGARGGVAVPAGGDGIAPTGGLELGVAADSGLGIGLHLITMSNPPAAPSLGIGKAAWGLGAMADFRWYFQTVRPLTLYPTFAVGFAAGPGQLDNKNVVLPMVNPGFGARVRLGQLYFAFEFGAANFSIPFINIGIGWEPPRMPDPAEQEDA